ncbi:MAG: DUF4127 family protein [Selenomonadaceae bacterium]|nr:DUF4127 family protein [Selenomonadaceae bacterium]
MLIILLFQFSTADAFGKVLLVPLDSRPACKNFVIDAAKIANIEVIVPPHQLLDYYTVAGENIETRQWILDNAKDVDAVIISVDQILYGGLIAARESEIDDKDIDEMINFFYEFKNKFPMMPVYAFSILPRSDPQSSIDNYFQRRALKNYSRLIGRYYAGQYPDDEALVEAYAEIKPDILYKYNSHFDENLHLNRRLIDLTNSGVIDKLILGRDDAEEFSIQSLEANKLQKYIKQNSIYNNERNNLYDSNIISSYKNAVNVYCNEKIFISYGADEIALTLLTKFAIKNFVPKIYVCYNDERTAETTLPYMSADVETVVADKIKQFNGIMVNSPDKADFVLFVSVNDNEFVNQSALDKQAEMIAGFIDNGHKVSLVDLGIHFDKSETLLPVLIDRGVSVNSLIAYSGWNTASNSIGTALSQAILFTRAIKNTITDDEKLRVYRSNLTFLNQRIIEDYIYLKDVIDTVNHALKKSGSYDTSYLDYNTEYVFADFVLEAAMNKKIADYVSTSSFRKPIHINTLNGNNKIYLKDIESRFRFPWARTFEILLSIKLVEYDNH